VAGVKRGATPIVALDYPSVEAALALMRRLGKRCSFYKIGSELFTAAGPDVVRQVRDQGADVFLDLKFHDIPHTVAGAVRSAVGLGVRLITVHASGGSAMLAAAVDAAGDQSKVGILGVTVLTSLTGAEVAETWGRPEVDSAVEVLRLAGMVDRAGAHGIVCSGQEADAVRRQFGDRLSLLIPGVRPAGEAAQDQARVVTPTRAVQAGASYIILGRAVTGAADPAMAMDEINAEIARAGS
jgi:orotidine-5'-phosphate decarboxylase